MKDERGNIIRLVDSLNEYAKKDWYKYNQRSNRRNYAGIKATISIGGTII